MTADNCREHFGKSRKDDRRIADHLNVRMLEQSCVFCTAYVNGSDRSMLLCEMCTRNLLSVMIWTIIRFVTLSVYRNMAVVHKTSQQHPIFILPSNVHV